MKAKLNDVLFLNISQNCIQILSDCIYNYPVLCFVTTKPDFLALLIVILDLLEAVLYGPYVLLTRQPPDVHASKTNLQI